MYRIRSYEVVESLPGKTDFAFARDVRFETNDKVLIRTFAPRTASSSVGRALIEEGRLLTRLELPTFKFLEVGYDEVLNLDFYAVIVPGRFVPLSFGSRAEGERIRLLIAAGIAVQELNQKGAAYRNFAPEAFGRLDDSILLYDFGRATAIGNGPLRALPGRPELFDPPEGQHGEYDVIKAEAFGFGYLIREARLGHRPLARLVDELLSASPGRRPTIDDAIAELRVVLATQGA